MEDCLWVFSRLLNGGIKDFSHSTQQRIKGDVCGSWCLFCLFCLGKKNLFFFYLHNLMMDILPLSKYLISGTL